MFKIRNYKDEDFQMIQGWWRAAEEVAPLPGMLPEESTFILEAEGDAALCVTVYLTNSLEIAYLENFVGNPDLAGIRGALVPMLFDYVKKFARQRGYRRLIALAPNEKLERRYGEIGLNKTLGNLTAMTKELF